MPAYALFDNAEVTDPARLEVYKQKVAPVVAQFGGRYVVLGGRIDRMEGDWAPSFLVMLEFPDLAAAHRWYASPEYAELKALRQAAGRFHAVFVEGLAPDPPMPSAPVS